MLRLYSFIMFCVFLFCNAGYSYDPVISNCTETPEIYTNLANAPAQFNKSNNLIRKPGSPHKADGNLIYIRGRVTDINCVPIPGASVSIWQANSKGSYQGSKHEMYLSFHDQNFIGSGQFTTDNLGNYNFVTVMPGITDGSMVPYIGFFIQHPEFMNLETRMFFPEYKNNHNEKQVSLELTPLLVAIPEQTKSGANIYKFDITLGNVSRYRTY